MNPDPKDWIFVISFILGLVLIWPGLGYLMPDWLVVAMTIGIGLFIFFAALNGLNSRYGSLTFRDFLLINATIWIALGLMWAGYFLRNGAWPLQ